MSLTNVPASLKAADVTRFALRASQLEKIKPAVAYWCIYHVVNQIVGKRLHLQDKECESYTLNLMDKLEQMKAAHASEDIFNDEVIAKAYVEEFALDTFQRADNAVRANKASAQTAETFRAAATFLDLLAVWGALDREASAKSKFAKYHAIRIAKAIKAGEDPNLSNPVQEPEPIEEAPPLDPTDPEVQLFTQTYQPTIEDVPDDGRPSPPISAPRASPLAMPSNLDSLGTADVSPIAPSPEPQKDEMDFSQIPTFTSEPPVTNRPTAPLEHPIAPDPMAIDPQSFYAPTQPINPGHSSAAFSPQPSVPQIPQVSPQAPPQIPRQVAPHIPPQVPVAPRQEPQPQYRPQQPPPNIPQASQPPPIQTFSNVQHATPGAYNTDEKSMVLAQKHAKWAISALAFEDVPTAVKELRIALRALERQNVRCLASYLAEKGKEETGGA